MRDEAVTAIACLPIVTFTNLEVSMSRSRRTRTTLIASLAGCLTMAGTALAQTQPASPAQPQAPSYSSSATQMSGAPNKSEPASSAFEKLDAAHAGYVTKEQVAKLDGFDKAFMEADKDQNGKLSRDEFQAAWAIYTRG